MWVLAECLSVSWFAPQQHHRARERTNSQWKQWQKCGDVCEFSFSPTESSFRDTSLVRSFTEDNRPPSQFHLIPFQSSSSAHMANDSLGSSSLIITIHNAHMTCTHTHFYLNWLWSTPKLGLFYFPEFTLASSGNDERQERRCEWTVIGKCQPFANFKWGFSAPLWFCFGEKILLSGGMVIIRIRRVEDELPEFFLSIDLLLFSHILLRHQRNEFASRPVENNH